MAEAPATRGQAIDVPDNAVSLQLLESSPSEAAEKTCAPGVEQSGLQATGGGGGNSNVYRVRMGLGGVGIGEGRGGGKE